MFVHDVLFLVIMNLLTVKLCPNNLNFVPDKWKFIESGYLVRKLSKLHHRSPSAFEVPLDFAPLLLGAAWMVLWLCTWHTLVQADSIAQDNCFAHLELLPCTCLCWGVFVTWGYFECRMERHSGLYIKLALNRGRSEPLTMELS